MTLYLTGVCTILSTPLKSVTNNKRSSTTNYIPKWPLHTSNSFNKLNIMTSEQVDFFIPDLSHLTALVFAMSNLFIWQRRVMSLRNHLHLPQRYYGGFFHLHVRAEPPFERYHVSDYNKSTWSFSSASHSQTLMMSCMWVRVSPEPHDYSFTALMGLTIQILLRMCSVMHVETNPFCFLFRM